MREAVRALILHPTEKALLLGKRSNQAKHSPGQWSLFGGTVEDGETPEVAVVREVLEETGIVFVLEDLVGSHQNENWQTHFYSGRIEGELDISHDEHSDSGYFTWAEIAGMELAFDHKDIILGYLALNNL
jgi:8-oxo-dGTP pyrophosphatase MutT (NUDIX family)